MWLRIWEALKIPAFIFSLLIPVNDLQMYLKQGPSLFTDFTNYFIQPDLMDISPLLLLLLLQAGTLACAAQLTNA